MKARCGGGERIVKMRNLFRRASGATSVRRWGGLSAGAPVAHKDQDAIRYPGMRDGLGSDYLPRQQGRATFHATLLAPLAKGGSAAGLGARYGRLMQYNCDAVRISSRSPTAAGVAIAISSSP